VSAKKLVVSTYLQYILIALAALLLFVFVRQLSGVLLTFLFAAVLAYALNPVVRGLEAWRVPRAIAVTGVFAALITVVLAAEPEESPTVPAESPAPGEEAGVRGSVEGKR
jgi:predicted PurR-regulated permease PerM